MKQGSADRRYGGLPLFRDAQKNRGPPKRWSALRTTVGGSFEPTLIVGRYAPSGVIMASFVGRGHRKGPDSIKRGAYVPRTSVDTYAPPADEAPEWLLTCSLRVGYLFFVGRGTFFAFCCLKGVLGAPAS
jgi:hypothetical protein